MAVAEGVKEVLWLRGLVDDLGQVQDMTSVYCDSQSVIHLTKNQMYHKRTKHIDIKYHFVRDVVLQGTMTVQKISTAENSIDMLTKSIPSKKFRHCLSLVDLQST